MAKSKKRRKLLIFGGLVLLLAGLTTAAILKKREVEITVQTEKVARRNITEIVVANGKIQPVSQVKISPEVSGEIIELPFKEGQHIKKGDLILKIKPDTYIANRNQADAGYKSSLAGQSVAQANLERAESEFKRNEELYQRKLISESIYVDFLTARDVARAQLTNSIHQVEVAKAMLAQAEEALAKTTIVSPITGTVSKLNSELGERVVGTATMAGTEVMTLADLNQMEARVDIGEMDVILIAPGQNARLEVDAFKDRKFNGVVTEIANSAKGAGYGGSQQDATKFEVRIRLKDNEAFRPGMSVTAEIETRSRTNVLTVPIASVTTRLPKDANTQTNAARKGASAKVSTGSKQTNAPAGTNNAMAVASTSSDPTNKPSLTTNTPTGAGTNTAKADKKSKEKVKPIEVVFVVEADRVKMAPVKIGISDDDHWEITEGLKEGQEVVSGGYRAISRELEDDKKIRKGPAASGESAKEGDRKKKE